MIAFEERTGPVTDLAYPSRPVPSWWIDAKFGIFVHWGIYSVPAWAPGARVDGGTERDEYTHHRYAEWYANTMRIPGSPTAQYHRRTYGEHVRYQDLLDRWHAEDFDAEAFAGRCAAWGARYVVPTTKHHDGLCLWDSATTSFTTVHRGPRRDLVHELAGAVRAAGLRLGVYFSGALDWSVSDFGPITSNRELFEFRRNDAAFARLAATQLDELITRHAPDLLWNDIDWPDAGKTEAPFALRALFERYFAAVPDGVLNDRWGVPVHGYLTREYLAPRDEPEPWEATRGIGFSFGHNAAEVPGDRLTGPELIQLLVRTVAAGGNLLLNVGLTAAGQVPAHHAAVLDELGAWLADHGGSIYDTRAWHPELAGGPLVCTQDANGVNVFVLDGDGPVAVPVELTRLTGSLTLPDGRPADVVDGAVRLPPRHRREPVTVLRAEWR